MAFPSRKVQVERIARYLDTDYVEGKDLNEIAATIVDTFADMYGQEFKSPSLVPHVGMAFSHPSLSGVWHVAYHEYMRIWIVSASTKYGGFISPHGDFWSYASLSKAKAGTPGNNPAWMLGDMVSRRQRQFLYKVVATGDKCVLLKDERSGELTAECNENMEKYYHREVEPVSIDW